MLKLKSAFPKALGFFFHATLALMLIDWAVPELFWKGLISPYEISFVLTGLVFLGCFFFSGREMIRQVIQTLAVSKWMVLVLCAYLLMGIVTLFYAQSVIYAVTKYIVVVQMLFFGVCAFVYASMKRKVGGNILREIYANIGISAIIIAVLGYFGFFTGTKTVYLDRISPIPDYNQYTTILLIGLVCGIFWLLNLKIRKHYRYLAVSGLCCVLVPAIYIAGSRRSYLLMLAVMALLAGYLIVSEVLAYAKKKDVRQFGLSLGCVFLCIMCVVLSLNLLEGAVKDIADKRMQQIMGMPTDPTISLDGDGVGVINPDDTIPSVVIPGNDLSETYQTIASGTALAKRELIWNAALDKITASGPLRLIVGYGASYSADLYDDLTNPKVQQVHSAYGYNENNKAREHWMNTHNLFLQDILEGGIVLLVIQLAVVALAAVYTIKLLLREPLHGVTLGILYGILFVTLFLSSGRGMISNKFFWLLMTLQILAWDSLSHKERK